MKRRSIFLALFVLVAISLILATCADENPSEVITPPVETTVTFSIIQL